MNVLALKSGRLLQRVLRANAVFSSVFAVLFLIWASFWAGHIKIGMGSFYFLAANLGLFAVVLFMLSTPRWLEHNAALMIAAVVIVLDFLWVLGTFILIMLPDTVTETGLLIVLGIACVVGMFGVLQLIALLQLLKMKRGDGTQHAVGN